MARLSWRRGEWSKGDSNGGGVSGLSARAWGVDAAYGGNGGGDGGLLSATRESVETFGSTAGLASVGGAEGEVGAEGVAVGGDVVGAVNGAVVAAVVDAGGKKEDEGAKWRIGGDLAADIERR